MGCTGPRCDGTRRDRPAEAVRLLPQWLAIAYSLRVKITDFEAGKADEEHLYEVSQKGTDKTYVEFMSPREKGRHLLMLGDDMWIYLPDTSRPVRITPLERLSGDASNGDVARTNYAVDYSRRVSARRKSRQLKTATSST